MVLDGAGSLRTADLQAIIDSGRGDVPLNGSSLTDHLTMARDALGLQPWRAEAR